jgi:hypothetical protein
MDEGRTLKLRLKIEPEERTKAVFQKTLEFRRNRKLPNVLG